MAISVDYKSTPLKYADLAAPFEQIKEVYDQTQEAYDKVDKTVSTLESQIREGDTRAMQQYKAYMARFDPAIESFSHGMNVVNMSALTGLRHDMYKEIQPIANAALRRATLEDEQRKALSANPELIYERRASDMSLDTFMDDPLADYGRTINGETVYNRAREAFDHISKAFGDAKINYEEAPNGALMAEVTKETGLNAEQLNNLYKAYESGNLSTSDLEQLVVAQTAQNLFNQTGVQNWGNPSAELQVRNKIISALEYTLGTRDVTVQNLGGGSGGGTRGGGGTSTTGAGRRNWNLYNYYTQMDPDNASETMTRLLEQNDNDPAKVMHLARDVHRYNELVKKSEKGELSPSEEKAMNFLAKNKKIKEQLDSLKKSTSPDPKNVTTSGAGYISPGTTNTAYWNKFIDDYEKVYRYGLRLGYTDEQMAKENLPDPAQEFSIDKDLTPDALRHVGFSYTIAQKSDKELLLERALGQANPTELVVKNSADGKDIDFYSKTIKKEDFTDKDANIAIGDIKVVRDKIYLEVSLDDETHLVDISNVNPSLFGTVRQISTLMPQVAQAIRDPDGKLPEGLKQYFNDLGITEDVWKAAPIASKKEYVERMINQLYDLIGAALVGGDSESYKYNTDSYLGV